MPPIPYKRPDYMDPSVTDSWWTWAKRQVGTLVGADDPAGSVMGMVGAVEVPAAKAATAAKQAIKAYHGSPHDFDKFSLAAVGTGEGGQAYGHGLYFAENPETAKAYRENLASTKVTVMGQDQPVPSWSANMSPQPRVIRRLADKRAKFPDASDGEIVAQVRADIEKEGLNSYLSPEEANRYVREADILNAMEERGLKVERGGKTYEVNLNVSPDELLDWDKPLSEQSETVRQALGVGRAKVSPQVKADFASDLYGKRLEQLTSAERGEVERLAEEHANYYAGGGTGADLYQRMVTEAGGRSGHTEGIASKALREKGIKGIQYLDAGSRAAGKGTKNFVIFDDSLITIARKYGIPLAVLAGPTGRAMVDALAKRDAQQQAAQEKVSASRARYLPNR